MILSSPESHTTAESLSCVKERSSGPMTTLMATRCAQERKQQVYRVSRKDGLMKFTIMVTDVIFRFQLAAIEQSPRHVQAWELQVMNLQEVARLLVSLGFIDPNLAARLTDASTTITPLAGLTTIPFSDIAALTELLFPDDEPPSVEAQESYILITRGETNEEALAAAGFVPKIDGPLQ